MSTKKSPRINRNQIFDLIIIFVSVVVVIFSWVMIAKSYNRYKAVEAELGGQLSEFLKNNDYLKILENLEAESNTVQSAFNVSSQYIPVGSDETGIMGLITGTVNKYRGSVSQIRFDNYQKLSGFKKETYLIPYSVNITCDYIGLVNILDELCLSDRLIVIDSVNMAKKDSSSESSTLTVEIRAGSFFRPETKKN